MFTDELEAITGECATLRAHAESVFAELYRRMDALNLRSRRLYQLVQDRAELENKLRAAEIRANGMAMFRQALAVFGSLDLKRLDDVADERAFVLRQDDQEPLHDTPIYGLRARDIKALARIARSLLVDVT